MGATTSRTKGVGRIWVVVGVAFGIVLLAAIVATVIYRKGYMRFVAAESAIRVRGEPLHARELTFDEVETSTDVEAALARLEAALEDSPNTKEVLELDPGSLEVARTWEFASAAWPRIEEYKKFPTDPPSVPEGHEDSTYAHRLWLRVADPVAGRSLSQRDRLAIEIARLLNEPLLEMACAVCSGERETAESEMRALPLGGLMPDIRISTCIESVNVPLYTLYALAIQGDHAESLRRWKIAWDGAQRHRGVPCYFGCMMWRLNTHSALASLRMLLAWLPVGVDLRDIERELSSIDVQAHMRRALIGERALGNDAFEAFWQPLEKTAEFREGHYDAWFTRLWLHADRAFYLETMTDAVHRIGMPYPDALGARRDWERDIEEWPKWAVVSAMLTPKISQVLAARAETEATLRVAGTALIARRAGVDAARRAADALQDPFDGKPLRTRVDADGTFVVWSIGSDLTDDGGSDHGTGPERDSTGDIVWRVRAP